MAGYARDPRASLFGTELGWFESDDAAFAGIIMLDTDGEYSGILLARDLAGRFRWINQTSYFASADLAVSALAISMAAEAGEGAVVREQGDESSPIDFYDRLVPEDRLHERFLTLSEDTAWTAAREVVAQQMRWYEDQDGNFVEQFQTTGFDSRIWELYLFAMLVEAGHKVTSPKPAPDFVASGLAGRFAIEATTVNPPVINGVSVVVERPEEPTELASYIRNYLPIRYAGPLTAKLSKRYWERPAVAALPLVFAIQDFHAAGSMSFSGQGLQIYLYGKAIEEQDDGVVVSPVTSHVWGTKVIDSGFFFLPDAENVSAVLFNGEGTLSKFNRIGISAGFESKAMIVHRGIRLGSDGEEQFFSEQVAEGYEELWVDGMNVFHNPRAAIPLDPALLPGAAHHRWEVDRFVTTYPADHLDSSVTIVVKRA